MKGECGRRRRTASEGDEDVTLKRFKGTGEVEPNGQTDSGSITADCEATVIRATGTLAVIISEARDVVGGSGGQKTIANNTSSLQDHSNSRSTGVIKENGNATLSQDKTGSLAATAIPTSILTPPPLKPAPSAFSTTFPSLGQMPSLVPGAPAPKVTSTALAPERDDGVHSAFPRSAPLISPGPVTISSPSQDNSPSVVLSATPELNQQAPVWGSLPEVSQVSMLMGQLVSVTDVGFFSDLL